MKAIANVLRKIATFLDPPVVIDFSRLTSLAADKISSGTINVPNSR